MIMEEDFESVRNWIRRQRNRGRSWEEISLACKESVQELVNFLHTRVEDDFWPNLSVEDWNIIVRSLQNEEITRERLIDERGATVIGGVNENNLISIPEAEDSAWQCYKSKLVRDGFSKNTIDLMEDATLKTLRCLSRDTRNIGAVKGLVVGNVQSGKTANMAALMAMAADNGWNMFLILSGMMNNLREQTQRRLLGDLNFDRSNYNWQIIDYPRLGIYGTRLADCNLNQDSNIRYISVCIKNASRLRSIIEWLAYNPDNRSNVRLLIIDDEADQAGINTANNGERTTINRLILNLVNNRNSKGCQVGTPIQAINYIGYTATPYANVLNEGPGAESLYPSNFLTTLTTSDEYFGPQQVFGNEDDSAHSYPGLDIIRTVTEDEVNDISDIQESASNALPQSLIDSLCWFLNGVGYMRYNKYSKPVSMLIHTSRTVNHHNNMAAAVSSWINSTGADRIISICENLWNEETNRFSLEQFNASYPNYGGRASDYPSFETIRPYIGNLVECGLNTITVDREANRHEYSMGIHLCVDNSDKNNDPETNRRLIYPDADNMPGYAPAFIVVGGNTLSRGLTIEGLVSTYFLRPGHCADTLMQMGRWFGYRRGYELIPRIWMTQRTKSQFKFLADMDQKLRDEIKEMCAAGISPRECGPKIMNSPSAQFLQIVARNRMQDSVAADYDFAGHTMETGVFNNNMQQLSRNLELTKHFLQQLGNRATDVARNPYARNNSVWRAIPFQTIKDYLSNYVYSERLRGFNELDVLLQWLDNVTNDGVFGTWNVILAGIGSNDNTRVWEAGEGISTTMVKRSRRYLDDNIINVGVLRNFPDYLSDIPNQSCDGVLEHMRTVGHNQISLNKLRENVGLGGTPQLIIYIIDKDSQPNTRSRYPLNAVCDIVGFSVNIPGVRRGRNTVQNIRVNIPPQMLDIDDSEEKDF